MLTNNNTIPQKKFCLIFFRIIIIFQISKILAVIKISSKSNSFLPYDYKGGSLFKYNPSLCEGGITFSFKKFLLYFLILSLIRDCFSIIISSVKYNPFLCEGGITDLSKNPFYISSYFVSYEIVFQQSSTKSNGITFISFYLCP